MKQRVNCEDCLNFIFPVPVEPDNLISDISKAGCKLGKRVMFRNPARLTDIYFPERYGYIRLCNEFLNQK